MTELIQPPAPGGDLEASWGAAVTEGVNRMEQMFPSGGLARQYAGGCGFAPLPANRRSERKDGPSPFEIRRVEENEDAGIPYDGWEIYMPAGCVSVGSTCQPMNPKAYREKDGGEREDLPGWYRMPAPSEEPEDGDVWIVQVHAKCCAAISGVDEFAYWPKCYAWANVEKSDMTQQEREENVNDVGDTFSSSVGVIHWREVEKADGTKEIVPKYIRGVKTPIHVMDMEKATPFLLYFAFEVDEDDATLSFDRLFVRNRIFSAAGASYAANGMTEIETDDEAVYLKISAETTPYTAEIKSYKTIDDPDGETLSVPEQAESDKGNGDVLVRLYDLKNGHVIGNYLSSIQNIQIYQ